MKPIITITTDFGSEDGFVGAMKGVIYGLIPEATLVDISHQIPKHDVRACAFCIWNMFKFYGPGAVHIGVVDPGVGGGRRPILVFSPKSMQFFIGPDNGVFSFVIKEDKEAEVYKLDQPQYFRNPVSQTFHGRDIFASVAAYCCNRLQKRGFEGRWWETMGTRIKDPQLVALPDPQISNGRIDGEVIHIDRFGNCITNVTGDMIKKVFGGKELQIGVKDQIVGKLSKSYEEGVQGQLIAILGSTGFMELAINNASASESFGIGIGCKASLLAKSA